MVNCVVVCLKILRRAFASQEDRMAGVLLSYSYVNLANAVFRSDKSQDEHYANSSQSQSKIY